MKTIVNKLRFALLLGFVAFGMTVLAQSTPYINKMSFSTQLFMEEMAGNLTFEQDIPAPKITSPGVKPLPKPRRPIVDPDTIGDQAYISATVRITSESDIALLEREGVIIDCKFDNGLLTAMIPIDRLEQVAMIEGVKRINVATYMRPLTNLSRQATNVDDVLTLSQDARDAGLLKKYDGSGVILGIIDDGIDFQHKAFTDKNGNTRIKGAYCYNGSSVTANWTGSGTLPTTDDTTEDHGTHTSSIAGGSSVSVSGTTVTVTDDHSAATYGGMAPGADLFLGGTQLATTHILASFQKMSQYADQTGKPLVVSNSWGSTWGARDGYSDVSQVIAQYFGGNKTDRICLFAAGNEAGKAIGGVGGGRYVTGTASQASPLGTIIRSESYIESYGYQYYPNILANAWTRGTDCTGIGINLYVLNKSTGNLQYSYTYTSTNNGSQNNVTLQGLSMSVYVLFDYSDAAPGRHQVMVYLSNAKTTSNYVLAIEVFPIGGSNSTIDIYGGDWTYLTGNLTTSGHSWQYGTDDMSVGDEGTDPNVISVGSYVTRNGTYSTGDISDFSSYATEGSGPTGQMYPWITAPGEVIISAINHYVSSNNHGTVTVNNSTAPYGEMSGTSMATPAAAGIVALWLEAAREIGKPMTLNDIKEVMKETAIRDSWVTSGPHASHFGNGKIDALGGIEYILASNTTPAIVASPSTVSFELEPNYSENQTVSVIGRNLTGNISATLNDPSGVYSINSTTLSSDGGNLVITYSPTAEGTHNATVTLSSPGAESVTITITGTAAYKTEATIADGTTTNSYLPIYGNQYSSKQINQMIYPASMLTEIKGKKIKSMTFYPTAALSFYGGAFNVKMGMTTQATFVQTSYSRITANMQTVKTGQAAVRNDTQLVIEFDEPFEYTDGNLVIDFEVTTTGTRSSSQNFYGINPGSYTSFNSYGASTNNYGRYTSGSRRQFLPKVTFEWEVDMTPVTSGTVSPSSLDFTGTEIDNSANQTVTITNTGNQIFTPVIDTTGLPSEFEVTGNGSIAVGGTLDLTVTYTPTDEGPHSGSFTVTIGDQTYTVTVTGTGVSMISTLVSNTVMVPVYKSEAQAMAGIDYTVSDIDNDTDHGLAVSNSNGDINVQVVGNNNITSYDLYRQNGSNWAAVATAEHNGNTYAQQGGNSVTVADGATAWLAMVDNAGGYTSDNAWYVPVINANSVQNNPNTYGAERQQKMVTDMNVVVERAEMGTHTWTANGGKTYTHYTVTLNMNELVMPTAEDDMLSDYDLYKVRAWRQIDPNLLNEEVLVGAIHEGKNRSERATETGEFMMEEVGHDMFSKSTVVDGIGSMYFLGDNEDLESFYPTWTQPGTGEVMGTFGAQRLRLMTDEEYDEGGIDELPMTFIIRAYYTRSANIPETYPNHVQGNRDDETPADGKYYIMEYVFDYTLDINNPPITSLNGVLADRQVVGVTYVNALGMQSSKPFEGVNIVVTRYSDGSINTTKVVLK